MASREARVLFKAGVVVLTVEDMFRRVFWKSEFLGKEASVFWQEVNKTEPEGMPVAAWDEWGVKRGMSVGQFYNMIRGLVGAGMLEKKAQRWHTSSGFLRELDQLTILYSGLSGFRKTRGDQ